MVEKDSEKKRENKKICRGLREIGRNGEKHRSDEKNGTRIVGRRYS